MSKANQPYQIQRDLWRQYPTGITTIGPCYKGCGKPARGSAICPDCLEIELGKIVGPRLAKEYHAAIKSVKELEREMLK